MNRRMQLFVNEYLVTMNASEAARRAGYKPHYAGLRGYQLMRRPDVQVAIRDAMDARAKRTGIDSDRVIDELAAIAFSDMRKILDWGTYHVRLQPAETMTEADRAAIKSISVRIGKRGCGHVRVRLHDKFAALAMLMRHLGMDNALGGKAARAKLARKLSDRVRQSFDRADRMRAVGVLGRVRLAAKRATPVDG
ncbi:MAG: terminase small subunit [Alphaproteobacteria bacterium]|nr:terminase small subunit [Alphaproteobacteria bacterium]